MPYIADIWESHHKALGKGANHQRVDLWKTAINQATLHMYWVNHTHITKNVYTFSFNTILFLLKRRACYCFPCHPEYGELTQSNTLCHHVPINQKIPLLQGRQFYQDHCQPIAPSTDNSKSYFTSSQKHKNTRFPILGRFFYCFFTIFNILIIINNLLQNLVWSCRFKCTQNWAALSCH